MGALGHTANRRPTPPGEVLRKEFLEVHGIKQDQLAQSMGISRFRVNEVINGKRGITSETALLLACALGTSPEFWLNLQKAVDLYEARKTLGNALYRVKRLISEKSEKEIYYDLPDFGSP